MFVVCSIHKQNRFCNTLFLDVVLYFTHKKSTNRRRTALDAKYDRKVMTLWETSPNRRSNVTEP
ncbi:hypothetical protein H5410_025601 [Solanum commersonii]|uniref:Uncharacterized protein n=1 Tax=Solanum commersonii TaxID=4109 RepID=A0A9J5YWA0_SOLCO|nr:hypothetical protein H5410_025601 [Solanum commersonii]